MLKNKGFTFLIAILWLISTAVQAAEMVTATVSTDQAWGLLLGDELIVTVELPIMQHIALDEESLPAIDQRQGHWLTLREISFDARSDSEQVLMMLRYQVVNTGTAAQELLTPEFTIRQTDNTVIVIPGAPMMLSPILPATIADDTPAATLKVDHNAPLFDTAAQGKKTAFWAGLAGLCFLLSTLWHFVWRKQHRQPFEQALIQLRNIKGDDNAALEAAARILHEAFNRTAGETVVQSAVDDMLAQHSRLAAFTDEIKQFYRASSAYFFDSESVTDLSREQIVSLAKSCRRVERLA